MHLNLPQLTCIYAIQNKITKDQYIGATTNLRDRIRTHRKRLNNGKTHHTKLLEAWKHFGEDAFETIILQVCAAGDLPALEREYTQSLKPAYNVAQPKRLPFEGKFSLMPPRYTAFGVTWTKRQLWLRFGQVSMQMFEGRLKEGMELERALTLPHTPYQTYTYQGVTGTLPQMAAHFGRDEGTLRWRLKQGWPLGDALTTPT